MITYNNINIFASLSNSHLGHYMIRCSRYGYDLTGYTNDGGLYDAISNEDESEYTAEEAARMAMSLTGADDEINFKVEEMRDKFDGGVATWNADPFCIEGEAGEEVLRHIAENGYEEDDEPNPAQLDIEEDEMWDWKYYKSGELTFAVMK